MSSPEAAQQTGFNVTMARQGIVAKRRRHVQELCERHDIACEYQPRGVPHARADPERRRVLIPPTTMVRSYYLALHEIAHCVLGYDHDLPAAPQEAATWQWAIDHAIEAPTLGLKRLMFQDAVELPPGRPCCASRDHSQQCRNVPRAR